MRNFTMISPSFWTGRTGRDLRSAGNKAQLVALYLLSCPHANYIGMYRLPVAYIASDLNMNASDVVQTLKCIEQTGFARYDEATETAWIVEGARYQIGDDIKVADKRIKMIQREFESLPSDCAFLDAFFEKYAKSLKLSYRTGLNTSSMAQAVNHIAHAAVKEEIAQTSPAAASPIQPVQTAAEALSSALKALLEVRDCICPDEKGAKELSSRVQELVRREGNEVALCVVNLATEAGDYDMREFAQYEQIAIDRIGI